MWPLFTGSEYIHGYEQIAKAAKEGYIGGLLQCRVQGETSKEDLE